LIAIGAAVIISTLTKELIMPKIVDRTGEKHGRLLVLGLAGLRGKDRLCRVRCDCGAEKEVVQSKLIVKAKPIRSCGCLAKDNHYRVHPFDPDVNLKEQLVDKKARKTHGLTKHKFYHIWKTMITRCYTEACKSYKNYGGRGITVCDEWKSEPLEFLSWLEENGYKKGLEIDRRDNNGQYKPSNCRVVTQQDNCRNRRNTVTVEWEGKVIPMIELAEEYDINYATMYKRINTMKLSPVDAVNFKRKKR
jgi:hypothetical protein